MLKLHSIPQTDRFFFITSNIFVYLQLLLCVTVTTFQPDYLLVVKNYYLTKAPHMEIHIGRVFFLWLVKYLKHL